MYGKKDLYFIASRFLGMKEIPGEKHNPLVVAMLQLDANWIDDDETAWCSAFVNFCAHLLQLPRTKKLNARSWLGVGTPIDLDQAAPGDVVILSRGSNPALGHVALFHKRAGDFVELLGGNQGNQVSIARFPVSTIVGVRALAL